MNLNHKGVIGRAVPGHHCALALLQCSATCETDSFREEQERRAVSHSELWTKGKTEGEGTVAMPTAAVPQ